MTGEEDVSGELRCDREIATPAIFEVRELRLPALLAGLLVDRDIAPVGGADIDHPVADRDAPIPHGPKGLLDHRVKLWLVMPNRLPGSAVHRENIVIRRDVVDDAADDDRCRLKPILNIAWLMHPSDLKIFDVLGGDLLQRTIAPAGIVAVIRRPIRRIVLGCKGLYRICRDRSNADRERELCAEPRPLHVSS